MKLSLLDLTPALTMDIMPIIHQILVESLEVCHLIPIITLESSLGEANRDFELSIAAPNVSDTDSPPKILVNTPCSFRIAL